MPVEKKSSYPCENMDHYIMNRVLRHRLRNLCAGVKMTIERIAASTMQSNPQIGSRCDIVAAELDSLRDFTDRMDLLFDRLPSPEVKSLFMMITDMRMDFLKNYPFCNFEIKGAELNVSVRNGSLIQLALTELLQNAGDAAGENGNVCLSWSLKPDGGLCFGIVNDGAPMPENIPLDPPVPFNTEKSRHDGLGLAIAFRIAGETGTQLRFNTDNNNTQIEFIIPEAEIING
ncbi:MAG: sensor histidine kinase [Victivallales bacterium]|nr:sensor histidine kinase [Victivallales bacterium]